jgi:predicted metalloendopeptidase
VSEFHQRGIGDASVCRLSRMPVNFQEFFDAYHIQPGAPMWRAIDLRAKIW